MSAHVLSAVEQDANGRAICSGGQGDAEDAGRAGRSLAGSGSSDLVASRDGARSDELVFSLPGDLARYVVEKGSVTLDGVSLTVASRQEASFSVSLIPTTLELTTFGAARVGGLVNVEVDVLAKYVEQMLAPRLAALDIRLVELDARLAASEGRA